MIGSSLISCIIKMCNFYLCVKFQLFSMVGSVSRTPCLEVILSGHCWFLTGILEEGVILDIMNHYNMWFFPCVPNYSSLAWLEVHEDLPIHEVHTWIRCVTRTPRPQRPYLEDVDGSWLETWRGWGMGKSWETPLNLSWKFSTPNVYVNRISTGISSSMYLLGGGGLN